MLAVFLPLETGLFHTLICQFTGYFQCLLFRKLE